MSDFKPGDKVRDGDREVTVITVPFTAHWVRGENGKVEISPVGDLKHIPPADPRVDVVAKAVAKHAGESDWERTPTYVQEESRTIASVVLAAMDAMPDDKPAPAPLAVGDRIRILKDRLDSAVVKAGEVYEVSSVGGTSFSVWEDPNERLSEWYFNQSHEGTGYERVTGDGPTRVRDSDDDVWERQPDGTWNCTITGGDADYQGWSWETLNCTHGPLTPLES